MEKRTAVYILITIACWAGLIVVAAKHWGLVFDLIAYVGAIVIIAYACKLTVMPHHKPSYKNFHTGF